MDEGNDGDETPSMVNPTQQRYSTAIFSLRPPHHRPQSPKILLVASITGWTGSVSLVPAGCACPLATLSDVYAATAWSLTRKHQSIPNEDEQE